MNLKVQRFDKSHPLYTDRWIENIYPEKGLIGKFQSVFGQMVDEDGKFICYTLERKDTLISEGKRKYIFYDSPKNHCRVLLFEDSEGSNTFARKFEFHIANWAYQLEGCTAGGIGITFEIPMLTSSTSAFNKVMSLVGVETGFITHETLKEVV